MKGSYLNCSINPVSILVLTVYQGLVAEWMAIVPSMRT